VRFLVSPLHDTRIRERAVVAEIVVLAEVDLDGEGLGLVQFDAHGFGGHTPLFNTVVWGPSDDATFAEALLARGASPDVRASLAGWPVVTEIMTGRHDVAARVLHRLVNAPDVFGGFRAEAPALEMASVHHLAKLVDGEPLRRPWWFFDVRVQGRGVVDIPTHLVDRVQWLVPGEPRLVSARTWATRVPEEAFRRMTGEPGFPAALQSCVEGDTLVYESNTELVYRIGEVVTQASARWDLVLPPGGSRASARLWFRMPLLQWASSSRMRSHSVERAAWSSSSSAGVVFRACATCSRIRTEALPTPSSRLPRCR